MPQFKDLAKSIAIILTTRTINSPRFRWTRSFVSTIRQIIYPLHGCAKKRGGRLKASMMWYVSPLLSLTQREHFISEPLTKPLIEKREGGESRIQI